MWLVSTFIVCGVLLHSYPTEGHVALTFPLARRYAFDFLDNLHTPGPCGIPKGSGPVTKLKAGSTIDVTWIYTSHDSGYKIELINNADGSSESLTGDGWINKTFVEKHQVVIPNKVCSDCTLRTLIVAREYTCGERLFWSCADVEIQQASVACYGNGQELPTGKCQCTGRYYGDNCQYQYECLTAADCGNRGECVDTESDSDPKICFCDMGWYGVNCEKESSVKTKITDYSNYYKEELGHGFYMYQRILEATQEIEIILKVEAESWVAVGWRPKNFKSGCLNYPKPPNIDSLPSFDTPKETCGGLNKGFPQGVYPDLSLTDTTGEKVTDMACLDIVIGAVRGERSRIGDYYTKLLDTPRRDEFFGGAQDLSAAIGYKEGDKTVILFRKNLTATHRSDLSITKEPMLLSWAKGQVSSPTDERKFYKKFDLKYHGDNRGHVDYDFYRQLTMDDGVNSGKWSGRDGKYLVEWKYLSKTDEVEFTFTIDNLNRDGYYAVGFNSAEKEMIGSDVIIYAYHGRPALTDRYITGYSSPLVDEIQDLSIQKESHIGNKAVIVFRRKRVTGNDGDVRLDKCAYFMFGEGYTFNSVTNSVSKHKITPFVSPGLVCVGPTNDDDGADFQRTEKPLVNYIIMGACIAVGVVLFIGVSFYVCRKNGKRDDENSIVDTSF